MNILFLDQYSELGGAQHCLLDLLPAIRNAVVAMPGGGPLRARVESLGFETAHIDCGPYTSWRKTARDAVHFAAETPRLARQVRGLASAADLIYVNGPRLLPAVALSCANKPTIFHSHNYLPSGVARKISGLALRQVRAQVIANCRYVAETWQLYGLNTSVIYNGVEGPKSPLPPRHGPLTLGMIGRIAPWKGQREFVEVARIVHARQPTAQFLIYGETMFASEDYEREVRAAAARLPVVFAGWTDNVYGALSKMDVLLAPSAPLEATTRVILEAFAAGVRVVAFPSRGIAEVLSADCIAHSVEQMAKMALAPAPPQQRNPAAPEFTLERYRREVLQVIQRVSALSAKAETRVRTRTPNLPNTTS